MNNYWDTCDNIMISFGILSRIHVMAISSEIRIKATSMCYYVQVILSLCLIFLFYHAQSPFTLKACTEL